MRCNLSAQPGNNDIVVVKNDRSMQIIGTATYSAWGTANGVNFCCSLTSSVASPINAVKVLTGSGDDEIWFTAYDASGVEKNLSSNAQQTAPTWFVGYAYPGAGRDYVYGSNSTANDYRDHLTGENGADTLYGKIGADFISVAETRTVGVQSTGNSGEVVYGGNGRDDRRRHQQHRGHRHHHHRWRQPERFALYRTGELSHGANRAVLRRRRRHQIYSQSSYVAGAAGNIDGGSGSNGCDNPGGSTETACASAYSSAAFTAWTPIGCY